MVVIFGGIALVVVGWTQAESTLSEKGISSFTVHANTVESHSLPAHTQYLVQQKRLQAIDSCEVTGPGGAVKLTTITPSSSSDSTYQNIYRFTSGDAGTYQFDCRAKADGRTVTVNPSVGIAGVLTRPLSIVGIVVALGGFVIIVLAARGQKAAATKQVGPSPAPVFAPNAPYPGAPAPQPFAPYPGAPVYGPGVPAQPTFPTQPGVPGYSAPQGYPAVPGYPAAGSSPYLSAPAPYGPDVPAQYPQGYPGLAPQTNYPQVSPYPNQNTVPGEAPNQ